MSAPMEFKKYLQEIVESILTELSIPAKRVSVVQRSNDFKFGDFCVPSGCVKLAPDQTPLNPPSIVEKMVLNRLAECKLELPISKVSSDQHNAVQIYLDRTAVFKKIIEEVVTNADNYGCDSTNKTERVVVNNTHLYQAVSAEKQTSNDMPLNILRSVIIQDHATRLLEANGYDVVCPVTSSVPAAFVDILKQLNIDKFAEHSATNISEDNAVTMLSKSPYAKQNRSSISKQELHSEKCDQKEQEVQTLDLDLKQYIQDKHLKSGKTDFEKNLSYCNVCFDGKPSGTLSEAVWLLDVSKKSSSTQCVHVVNEAQAFKQQKCVLLLHELVLQEAASLKQRCVICGPVTVKPSHEDGGVTSADDFLRLRHAELRQAAIMKYGESVHGEGWAANLEVLTAACVKFEMLSSVHRSILKLDVSDGRCDSGVAPSTGSFVMYNCARLATLFTRFEDAVDNGTYPALPALDDVDFSTLCEEKEWSLLFSYVYSYPDLVKKSVQDFQAGDSLITTIHTHKICEMLGSLSCCLSSYYSRYHILGEGRAHLLPRMYARLYLMKAVHQVMSNALALIGVKPLSQL